MDGIVAMATPQKKSGWGSFLQQAVAGVESRLDNILAEGAGEEAPKTASKPPTPTPGAGLAKPESSMSRFLRVGEWDAGPQC